VQPEALSPLANRQIDLVGSRSLEDRTRGATEDLQVKHQRPVVDVPEVQSQRLVPGQVTAPADLPEAGEPGLHPQAAHGIRLVLCDLARKRRPRTDQGHLASHHVDQLRQLIQREPPQDPADASDPRVVLDLEEHLVGVVAG